MGFAAERELPIIRKIAVGSLKNKLLYLLPAAVVLSLVAPWAITPLLMLGGAYLCYEGTEKVYEALWPHAAHHHEAVVGATSDDPQGLEDKKVSGAIKTDFILSAEIMAIALASLPDTSFLGQAAILAVVGIGITVLVYGAVALIVKADDAGVALARAETPVSSLMGRWRKARSAAAPSAADRSLRPLTQALGRGLVKGMPVLLTILSVVGTAAMIWVGGGIVIHGLEEYGFSSLAHAIEAAGDSAGHALPAIEAGAEWFVAAAGSGVFGLLLGSVLIPFVQWVAAPALRRLRPEVKRASH
jgi:predicted DNA repair protein MutK